jgi:predicted DCC family thiol-disulfide oxidoreductase YuxK
MESRRDHALLYDADCGFCRLSVRMLLSLDRDDRLRAVAIQSEEGERLLGEVPAELRLASFHLVTPGGTVVSGADAAPLLARLIPGGDVPARAMRRFPGATEAGYAFISRHRGTLGRIGLRAGPLA